MDLLRPVTQALSQKPRLRALPRLREQSVSVRPNSLSQAISFSTNQCRSGRRRLGSFKALVRGPTLFKTG